MATKDFMTLTNDAILEAGIDAALFSGSGDFGSPTDNMKLRFKGWVSKAWRDVQQENPDWEMMMNEAIYVISPRINFFNGSSLTATGVVNGEGYGLTDNPDTWLVDPVSYIIPRDIYPIGSLILSGAFSTATARGWVDLDSNQTNPIKFQLHVGSEGLYYPGPTAAGGLVNHTVMLPVESWGSYNFAEAPSRYALLENAADEGINDIKNINQASFKILNYASNVANGAGTPNERELTFVPWESFFKDTFDFGMMVPGVPRYVTEDYEGRYRFWPPPDRDYTIVFKYQRTPQILEEYNDVPNIVSEFEDIIVWRALQYYGRYDADPSIANPNGTGYADQNYKRFLDRMEFQYREKFHFKPHRMWT